MHAGLDVVNPYATEGEKERKWEEREEKERRWEVRGEEEERYYAEGQCLLFTADKRGGVCVWNVSRGKTQATIDVTHV